MGYGNVLYIPLGQIDISLLADQVGISAANTLDLSQGVHDLLLSVNIGVKKTENELEVRLLAGYERYSEIIFSRQHKFKPISLLNFLLPKMHIRVKINPLETTTLKPLDITVCSLPSFPILSPYIKLGQGVCGWTV